MNNKVIDTNAESLDRDCLLNSCVDYIWTAVEGDVRANGKLAFKGRRALQDFLNNMYHKGFIEGWKESPMKTWLNLASAFNVVAEWLDIASRPDTADKFPVGSKNWKPLGNPHKGKRQRYRETITGKNAKALTEAGQRRDKSVPVIVEKKVETKVETKPKVEKKPEPRQKRKYGVLTKGDDLLDVVLEAENVNAAKAAAFDKLGFKLAPISSSTKINL
jgi:hypothetical protein